MADSETLSSKQRAAIVAILSTPTLAEAAAHVGVTRRTIYRWLKQAEFREALEQAQGEVVHVATVRLTALLSQALEIIGKELGGDDGKARFRAAAVVLARFATLASYVDLVRRVEALEQMNTGRGESNGES